MSNQSEAEKYLKEVKEGEEKPETTTYTISHELLHFFVGSTDSYYGDGWRAPESTREEWDILEIAYEKEIHDRLEVYRLDRERKEYERLKAKYE